MELYRKYRPRALKEVVGQDAVVSQLEDMIDRETLPHFLILSGPSGCGKTTIARILKSILECGSADFSEINAADSRGIDTVRDIRSHMSLRPISGKSRIWLIDEAHKLTNDAQNALLKMLEDTPSHVYFFLATTDSPKIIRTIHTRGTELKLKAMSEEALRQVLDDVAHKERMKVSDDVLAAIVDACEGSMRKALVILGAVGHLRGDKDQLKAVTSTTHTREQAFDLARLLFARGASWAEAAKILRSVKEEDPEGIRYTILGYARSCMVGSDTKPPNAALGSRAFQVIDIFGRNFYDSKHAGLAAACWEAIHK